MDIINKYNIDIDQITLKEARELCHFLYQKEWRAKHMIGYDPKRRVGRPKLYTEVEMAERIRVKKAEYRKKRALKTNSSSTKLPVVVLSSDIEENNSRDQ